MGYSKSALQRITDGLCVDGCGEAAAENCRRCDKCREAVNEFERLRREVNIRSTGRHYWPRVNGRKRKQRKGHEQVGNL